MSIAHIIVGVFSHLVPLAFMLQLLPRREDFALRASIAFCVFAAFFTLTAAPGVPVISDIIMGPYGAIGLFSIFCIMIALMTGIALACCSCTLLTATFCSISAYTIQNIGSGLANLAMMLTVGNVPGPHDQGLTATIVGYVVADVICYCVFVRPISKRGLAPIEDSRMQALVLAVVFFDIVFDMASKRISSLDVPLHLVLILLVAHLGVCALILFISYELIFSRHLLVEQKATEQMMLERERQYRATRENIDAINVKCHDIRHQIRRLGGSAAVDPAALEDIAREVNVYDSTFDTGNDALDTILTEKALVCDKAGIRMTCIAEGSALSFLTPAELYALFGNMLDNAIEAVSPLPEEDRAISLRVQEKFGMAGIHMENRFAGERSFSDGLPVTTKEDTENHGFGMRSMQGIVARHGGTMTVHADDGVFSLNMMIPR